MEGDVGVWGNGLLFYHSIHTRGMSGISDASELFPVQEAAQAASLEGYLEFRSGGN